MSKPENTCQENAPSSVANAVRLMRQIFASPKLLRRFALWSVSGLVLTTALGAAANHLLSTAQTPEKPLSKPQDHSDWNGQSTGWWTPNSVANNSPDTDTTVPPLPQTSSHQQTPTNAPATPKPANQGPSFSGGAVLLRDNAGSIATASVHGASSFRNVPNIRTAPIANPTYRNPDLGQVSDAAAKAVAKATAQGQAAIAAGTLKVSSGNTSSTSAKKTTLVGANHDYQLGAGELFLNNPQPVSSGASEATYALLGLGTSSTPSSDTSSEVVSAVLHFSMSATLISTPVLGISDGSNPVYAVTPEPASCGLLAMGAAMFGFVRRRRQSGAA